MTLHFRSGTVIAAPHAEMTITDLDTLKVMADPLRLHIRELMLQPGTVKQVAAELDIPATKLYYHVNLLEKHGLIAVVGSRLVSGIVEKQYQVTAYRLRVAPHLLSQTGTPGDEREQSIRAVFDSTRDDLLGAIQSGVVDVSPHSALHAGAQLATLRLRLDDEQALALFLEIATLVRQYAAQRSTA